MKKLVLRVCEPDQAPREYGVSVGMTLGRHPDNDCVFTDPKTSAHHAHVVALEDGRFAIEDLGSSNKTRVEGGPVLGKGDRFPLEAGLTLTLGLTTIEIKDAALPQATQMLPLPDSEMPDESDESDESSLPTEAPTEEKPVVKEVEDVVIEGAESTTLHSPLEVMGDAFEGKTSEEFTLGFAPSEPVDDLESTVVPGTPAPVESSPPAVDPNLESTVVPQGRGASAPETPASEEEPAEATIRSEPRSREELEALVARTAQEEPEDDATLVLDKSGNAGPSISLMQFIRRMNPRLIFDTEGKRESVPIINSEFAIGRKRRTAESDVDLAIDHTTVSVQHAVIKLHKNRFFLEDKGSKNGTYIDGKPIPIMDSRELRPGSAVRFGIVDALFLADADAELSPLEPGPENSIVLKVLVRKGIISAKAKTLAERSPLHPAEFLILEGACSVTDWSKALRAVRDGGVGTGASARSGQGLKIALAVAVLIALACALLYLLRPDLFGG